MPYMADTCNISNRKKRKEKFTLFSDHNGSLLRRQTYAIAATVHVFQVE